MARPGHSGRLSTYFRRCRCCRAVLEVPAWCQWVGAAGILTGLTLRWSRRATAARAWGAVVVCHLRHQHGRAGSATITALGLSIRASRVGIGMYRSTRGPRADTLARDQLLFSFRAVQIRQLLPAHLGPAILDSPLRRRRKLLPGRFGQRPARPGDGFSGRRAAGRGRSVLRADARRRSVAPSSCMDCCW